MQHHAAIPMGSATTDSKTPYKYAHTTTPKAASSHRYTAAKKKRQTDRSRNRRTDEVPFIAGCSHFTRKNTRFRAPASSPKHSPCNIMQPFQWDLQRQIPKHPITTHTQPHPKQLQATVTLRQKKRQTDRSRNRRTDEVPFIAGCSHFTRKNTRFRAPASSPKHSPCNIMQPFQWDLQPQIPKHPINTHTQAHPKQLEATVTLRQKKNDKPTAAATAAQTRYLSSPAAATLHGKTQGFVLRLPPQNRALATSCTTPLYGCQFPSSPLPFIITSLPLHFPSSPLPFLTTSLRHHSPSSSLPFVTTPLHHHFPSSPLPFVPSSSLPFFTASPRHHFPSSPLPFVTTPLHHHFPSSPLPFVTTSLLHHFPSSPLPFVTTPLHHHFPSSPLPFVTTYLPHHFPSSPLPFVTTPLHHHFPSSPLPFVTTSLPHHFPSSPLPFIITSLLHRFPSSPLPFLTTSHRHHLPSSPLPFITTSLRHHFPSSPLPIVTTSLRHHPVS